VDHSLRFDSDMPVPTFVDLQGFPLSRVRGFVVKEFAALRKGSVLSHYIFESPEPWELLMKSEKSCASWLAAYHHGLQWKNGMIPYGRARQLITTAVLDNENVNDKDIVIYVKGHEKREWLRDLIQYDRRDRAYIETLDADYEDVDSLNNLDATIKCGQHRTDNHCALENVFKLFKWWSNNHE
jgi:hypothetical protein